MSFDKLYDRRMSVRGKSSYERNLNLKIRQFKQYFNGALNREPVTIDYVDQEAIFQDQNQSNNKDLSDDKYIITPLESNLRSGSYIHWRDKLWMAFTEEEKTIKSHKQAKIKDANHFIKWMNGSKIVNNGTGYPAFIQNQTLYTLGVSSSGSHSWIVNAKMTVYLQDNSETRTLKIGQRIFIGEEVYQIMFRDFVSRDGIIHFLMEQDFVNPDRDDVENKVADYFTALDKVEIEESVGASKEVVIAGSEKAKIGSLVRYDATIFSDGLSLQEGITDWTIADIDHVAMVVEQTPEYIKLRIENNFKKVGSKITVIGKTADGVLGSKSVNIVSPY